jgi:4-aminobutyrate aminotransferase-like enzyme
MKKDLLQRRLRAMGPAYRLFYREPVHLVRGEGVWLFDSKGQKYLDCYNNVASVGHCHPHVVDALANQAATLNTHTRYLHENVVRYAERLGNTLPGELSTCMFVCTGTEANDLAFRIARTVTGHEGAIVTEHAYHGNSIVVTELSTEDYPASERPGYLETVEAPNPYRGAYRYGDPEWGDSYAALADRAVARLAGRGKKPAMFICDNIFSSNGILTPPPEYLHSDVVPDIVTMGKPIGDGHPLAAVVTTPAIAEAFARQFHYFNTFGGNPVSAAVGSAVLDVIEKENILQNVNQVGAQLRAGLMALSRKHERVGDVRGKGLFYGVEMVRDRKSLEPAKEEAQGIREHLRDNGVLLGTTGPLDNVIKIRPPLVFSGSNAVELLEKLELANKAHERIRDFKN